MSNEWEHGTCSCMSHCGTCLQGHYVPCILFAKTQYKLEHGNLEGYSCCSGTCMKFWMIGFTCFGRCLRRDQRNAIQQKYNLKESSDNCCCPCVSVIQNANEVNFHEKQRQSTKGYVKPGQMTYQ